MSPTFKAKAGRFLHGPLFAYIVVLSIFAVGILLNSERMDHQQAKQLRASCERGNAVRAYLLLRAREFQIADGQHASRTTIIAPGLFPLLDCDTGKRMSTWRSEHYLTVLRDSGHPPTS